MITIIEGQIEIKNIKFVVVKNQGVGYKVFCSPKTLAELPEQGQIRLFTHSYIRQDNFDLYGFLTFEELEFFEMLIGVSGIGPKAALGVLSIASVEEIKNSIASGQASLLTKVSGVGKKTAERVVLELGNKMEVSVSGVKQTVADQEVIEALMSLGYSQSQAKKALSEIPEEVEKVEDRVKEALKVLGR